MTKEQIHKIFTNFSSLIFSQAIFKIINLFVMILIARFLGVDGFGELSYCLSFVWVFLFLADFGLTDIFLRDVSHNRGFLHKYINNIVTLKVLLAIANILVIIVLAKLTSLSSGKFWIILILGISVISDSFMYFFRYIFRVNETMHYEGMLMILESIIKLGIIFSITKTNLNIHGPVFIAVGLLVASFINCLTSLFAFLHNVKVISFSIDYGLWRRLLRASSPLILIYILGFLNFRIDIMMLTLIKGDMAAGWFSADFKLLEQLFLIPVTLSAVFFPVFSKLSDSINSIDVLIKRSVLTLVLISFLFIAAIYAKGSDIIRVVYGAKFDDASKYLATLSLLLAPFFIKPVFERLLFALRKQFLICKIYLLGIVGNVILNCFMIPRLGINGAVLSTLFCEAVVVAWLFVSFKRSKATSISIEEGVASNISNLVEKESY